MESATDPSKSLTWKQACATIATDEIAVIAQRPNDWQAPPAAGYGGVQFAQVPVDIETGVVRVLKVVAVQECGRLLNPLAVQSQINGGIIHGISWALFEARRLDPQTGAMRSASPARGRARWSSGRSWSRRKRTSCGRSTCAQAR